MTTKPKLSTKTYLVGVREVHVQQVRVNAKSGAEAIKKVADGEGDYLDDMLEYSHTSDTDTWTVEEEN